MVGFAERYTKQGKQQGLLAGERAILERQFRRRIGPLDEEKLQRVTTWELEKWAHKVLDADLEWRTKHIDFVDLFNGLNDDELRCFEQKYPEEFAAMETFAQRYRERGKQRGLREGQLAVLQRQLQRRFGTLTPQVTARLENASPLELEVWADRILDAEGLDDIFEWTQAPLSVGYSGKEDSP